MIHPQKLIYVGVDLHKQHHTAVIIDCWNKRLGEIKFDNKPSTLNIIAEADKSVDYFTGNTSPLPGVGDQSWHFDTDPGSGDSRQEHADVMLKLAKSQWRNADRQYMSRLVKIERMQRDGIDTGDMLADQ